MELIPEVDFWYLCQNSVLSDALCTCFGTTWCRIDVFSIAKMYSKSLIQFVLFKQLKKLQACTWIANELGAACRARRKNWCLCSDFAPQVSSELLEGSQQMETAALRDSSGRLDLKYSSVGRLIYLLVLFIYIYL